LSFASSPPRLARSRTGTWTPRVLARPVPPCSSAAFCVFGLWCCCALVKGCNLQADGRGVRKVTVATFFTILFFTQQPLFQHTFPYQVWPAEHLRRGRRHMRHQRGAVLQDAAVAGCLRSGCQRFTRGRARMARPAVCDLGALMLTASSAAGWLLYRACSPFCHQLGAPFARHCWAPHPAEPRQLCVPHVCCSAQQAMQGSASPCTPSVVAAALKTFCISVHRLKAHVMHIGTV